MRKEKKEEAEEETVTEDVSHSRTNATSHVIHSVNMIQVKGIHQGHFSINIIRQKKDKYVTQQRGFLGTSGEKRESRPTQPAHSSCCDPFFRTRSVRYRNGF